MFRDVILDREEFQAALYARAKVPHYPTLSFHADVPGNPDHRGGLILEGVIVDSLTVRYSTTDGRPVLSVNLNSPERVQLSVNNIRCFQVRTARYWNEAHPLTATFHRIVAHKSSQPGRPDWLKTLVERFNAAHPRQEKKRVRKAAMPKKWSREKIQDQFTGLLKKDGTPMSRQQLHILRKKAKGLCVVCSKPALGIHCLEHSVEARERQRKINKSRKRLKNAMSYKAEREA